MWKRLVNDVDVIIYVYVYMKLTHERLFLEAWVLTKDLNARNDPIVIPDAYKSLVSAYLSRYVL